MQHKFEIGTRTEARDLLYAAAEKLKKAEHAEDHVKKINDLAETLLLEEVRIKERYDDNV